LRRLTALLEVLGVYLAAGALEDLFIGLLAHWKIVSIKDPFALLTRHTSDADLLLASRRLLLIWVLQYGAYFTLIVPLNWWYRHRGPKEYGLTRGGHSIGWLLSAGLATACLFEWPVIVLSLVDAVHPLGAMAPWRQAFFNMSWQRWQFWFFAGVLSYVCVPILEELLFHGYFQRRLAEDWGDAPAILGTSCLFVFAHKQYLIPNAYNIGMIFSLLCVALGLGLVFAYTRSLLPSILAHAIINVPMTPKWQLLVLVGLLAGILFFFKPGLQAIRQVIGRPSVASCFLLASVGALYAISSQHFAFMTTIAIALVVAAIGLEWKIREQNDSIQSL
jgi:membrane protease YdiL (CAAX protease family)